ncbi:hypothetical protein [Micrococcus sp.]|uniref:hypothetical protein n=1 Tax=Micrococcus sp. TaxID=1271 RepID=UPI002A91F600|nr:hypothetical protein [Micrococcus sp.]MDY6054361.1 hypothetical protein [Micrococcus sp.]
MNTDPVELAREVLDAHAAWGKTGPGTDECEQASHAFTSAVRRHGYDLARAVLAVSELHRPIRAYDECHDPECRNEHIELEDYWGCDSTVIGWACDECCYDNGNPLECKKHGGDHTGVTADQACSTRAALTKDGQAHS